MATKKPELSKEAIATSIGFTVVQSLDFFANEMKLKEQEIQKVWSPFLAATARIVKPADEMANSFSTHAKKSEVKSAIDKEIEKPFLDFYESFNDSLKAYLKSLAQDIGEVGYLESVTHRLIFDKKKMNQELNNLVHHHITHQNLKGRKEQDTDELFTLIFCFVLTQHIEDTLEWISINGVKNTSKIIEYGQVIFATVLLLQIIKGML